MNKDFVEKSNEETTRLTIAQLVGEFLSSGQANTKEEAIARARLKIANSKAEKAKEKIKEIEEAKRRLEREKAKQLRREESSKQRKAETRRKIELGGLIIKAGLDSWDTATLLGYLLSGVNLDDQEKEALRQIGAEAFKLSAKTPLVSIAVETPHEMQNTEIIQYLQGIGLKQEDVQYDRPATSGNELLKAWQGNILQDQIDGVKSWVESWGGKFIIVNKLV